MEKSAFNSEKTSLPITTLYGVSSAREKLFAKLGITTLSDLVFHFPVSHENRGDVKKTCEVQNGECVSLILEIITPITNTRIQSRSKRQMTVQKFVASDETGSVKITCFNRNFLSSSIKVGNRYRFYGTVNGVAGLYTMTSPVIESADGKKLLSLVPKYPLTAGLTSNIVSSCIKQALEICKDCIYDYLTNEERDELSLCTRYEALCYIHFPKDFKELEEGKRRLAFDELYAFQLKSALLGENVKSGRAYRVDYPDMKPLLSRLPFEMTRAQKRTLHEILCDMSGAENPHENKRDELFVVPSRRLVQGDVGSGKTIVALGAMYATAKSGFQSALMVPTGILARQHFDDAEKLFSEFGIRVALLTGATKTSEKKQILKDLKDGNIDCLIGTHALIEDNVQFKNIALVVTDEQHRFGVGQRKTLEEKGNEKIFPHTVVMSATPIPRTLAMILYCDLDISIIDELPKGRSKVDTFAVGEDYHERVYKFIRDRVSEGRQAYVVCPLAEEKNADGEYIQNSNYEMKSAKVFCEKLRENELCDLRVEYVHGRMRQDEKDSVMGRFAKGEIDVLVSTTVIEVGVNVPNSVVMLIENAERFGLSQLHQLRGRVGRGEHKSYCILISPLMNKSKDSDFAKRVQILCKTGDGFEIAKKDLELRGPGEFFGKRQHGELCFKMADAMGDVRLLEAAKCVAQRHAKEKETRGLEIGKIGI